MHIIASIGFFPISNCLTDLNGFSQHFTQNGRQQLAGDSFLVRTNLGWIVTCYKQAGQPATVNHFHFK